MRPSLGAWPGGAARSSTWRRGACIARRARLPTRPAAGGILVVPGELAGPAPVVLRRRLPRLRAVRRARRATRARGWRSGRDRSTAPRRPAATAPAVAARRARPGMIRLATFTLLGAFAGSAWGTNLLAPSGSGRAVADGRDRWGDGRRDARPGRRAQPVRAQRRLRVAVVLAIGFMFEAAASAPACSSPTRWGDLAAGSRRALTRCPTRPCPTREWTRGCARRSCRARARCSSSRPRWRSGRARRRRARRGRSGGARRLYGVPAVERNFAHPFFSGAIFAILLTAFLWGERLERRYAGIAVSMGLRGAGPALLVAPRVDGGPAAARSPASGRPTEPPRATSSPGTHRYGPLNWPRDGHEVLRVKASDPTYWKAVNLDAVRRHSLARGGRHRPVPAGHPSRSRQPAVDARRSRSSSRDLRSFQYVTAGTALGIPGRSDCTRATRRARSSPVTTRCGPATPTARRSTRRARARRRWAAAGSNYPDQRSGRPLDALPASVGGRGPQPVHRAGRATATPRRSSSGRTARPRRRCSSRPTDSVPTRSRCCAGRATPASTRSLRGSRRSRTRPTTSSSACSARSGATRATPSRRR